MVNTGISSNQPIEPTQVWEGINNLSYAQIEPGQVWEVVHNLSDEQIGAKFIVVGTHKFKDRPMLHIYDLVDSNGKSCMHSAHYIIESCRMCP